MSTEDLIHSKNLVPVADAAALAGLSRDYVARLCRKHKIDGARIGNQWYVSSKSLHDFMVAQRAARAERRVLLAKERSDEYRGSARASAASVPVIVPTATADIEERPAPVEPASVISRSMPRVLGIAHNIVSFALVFFVTFAAYAAVHPEGARVIVDTLASSANGSASVQQEVQALAPIPTTSSGLAAVGTVGDPSSSSPFVRVLRAGMDAALAIVTAPFRLFAELGGGARQGSVSMQIASQQPTLAQPVLSQPAQVVTNTYNTYNTYNTTNNRAGDTFNYAMPSAGASGGVSESELQSKLDALASSLRFQATPTIVPSSGGVANSIALLQNIDTLTGTRLNNVSVNGITGLTASDIPALPYLAVSGGTLTGALNNTSTDLSTFAGGLAVDSLTVSSTTATSTFASGIDLSSGCFSVNGTCITGGSASVGGATGEIQYNTGSGFGGVSGFSYNPTSGNVGFGSSTPSAKFTIGGTASDTTSTLFAVSTSSESLFSVDNTGLTTFTKAIGTAATTTSFYSTTASSTYSYSTFGTFGSTTIGTLTLGSALGVGYGGTGTTTAPSYGQLLLGNSSGGYDLVSTSSLGIIGGGGGTWGSITGTLSNQTDLQNALDAKLNLSDWYATTTDALAEGTNNLYFTAARATANFVSNLAGTTSVASITTLPNLSLPSTQVNGTLGTINGTTFTRGDSITVAAASSSLLSDSNYFSGANIFAGHTTLSNATSSSFAITGITSALLKTSANGSVIPAIAGTDYAPATSGTSLLYGNGSGGFSNATVGPSLSFAVGTLALNTANSNWWTATQNFTNASTSQLTATSSVYFTALTGGALATDAAGKLYTYATSTWTFASSTLLADSNTFSGANTFSNTITGSITGNAGTATALQTARTINGVSFNGTGNITVTAASSTLLGDANTFSGVNAFTNNTTLANATSSSFAITSLANSLLATNGSGSIVATTSIGTNLLTGVLSQANGGTGISSYTAGEILYADNSGNLAKLPIGTSGQVLKVQAGLPAWGVDQTSGGGGSDGIFATSTGIIYPLDTASTLLIGTNSTSTNNSIFEVNGISYFSSKVGIATTSPATELSVGGSGYFTGGLGIGVYNPTAGTLQTSGNATIGGNLTAQQATTTNLAITSLTNSLLYTNGSGTVSAATVSGASGINFVGGTLSLSSIPNASLANSSITLNGTVVALGDNKTITAASSTLLSDSNTFSGINTFTNSGSNFAGTWQGYNPSAFQPAGTYVTSVSATYPILSSGGTSPVISTALSTSTTLASATTNGFLSSTDWTTFNGKQAALTFTYPLQNSANTVSLLFGTTTNNTWSGSNTFNGATQVASLTATNAPIFSALTNGLVGVGTTGATYAIATSSLDANITGNAGTATALQTAHTINGVSFNGTGNIIVTAASSTLLSDSNTFSGANTFTQPLSLTSTTGTTTIASGQGFTIGSSQFAVQGATGRVGIGTASPSYKLDVSGDTRFSGGTVSIGTIPAGNILLTANQNTTDPSTYQVAGNFQRNLVLTTTNANNIFGGSFTAAYTSGTSAYTGTLYGAQFTASHGTAATVSKAEGANFILYNTSTGTITNGYAGQFNIQNLNSAGKITNAYGAYVGGGFNLGTINNEYGLYVDSLPAASTTYGLYVKDTQSYFGGNVGIGTTSPASKLSVVGSTYLAGSLYATSTVQLTNYTNGLLAVNGSGNLYTTATSSWTFASSTLLSDSNTFSGANSFTGATQVAGFTATGNTLLQQATTTNLAISNLTNALLSTNANGSIIATTTLSTSYLSGILPVVNGGTGWGNIAANTLLTGNGTGALATTSVGTGLQLAGGSLSNTGVLSIQQSYGSGQTGALTLATSSAATSNGVTVGQAISNASGTFTFTPTVSVANIPNAALQNSTISGIALGSSLANLSATNGTLTFSGTYNGSTARTIGLNLGNANTWTALQRFSNASSTLLSAYTAYFGGTATSSFNTAGQLTLAGLTNALLSTNGSGQVVATTSVNAGYITGALGTINGTTFNRGDSLTIGAASTTLLSDDNTFSGQNTFAGATTTFSNGIAAASSAFNVLGNGNVGIGTASPWTNLVVQGNATAIASFGPWAANNTFMSVYLNGSTGNNDYNFLSSASNQNLYINRPSGYSIYFREGNATAVTLLTGGNVGIGTTNPQSLLDVNGGVSIGSYAGTNAAPTNGMIVSGSVGIGTTTPTGTLGVNGSIFVFDGAATANNGAINLSDNSNGDGSAISSIFGYNQGLALSSYGAASNAPHLYIQSGGNVGIGTTAPVDQLTVTGTATTTTGLVPTASMGGTLLLSDSSTAVGAGGAILLGANSNTWNFAGIKGYLTNGGGGNAQGDVAFLTRPSSSNTTLSEAMRIKASGNVGIGTTTPGYQLQLTNPTIGSAGTFGVGSYTNAANQSIGQISFYNNSVATETGRISVSRTGTNYGGTMHFFTYPDAGSLTEAMTILGSGNLGIGTTTPATNLMVSGSGNTGLRIESTNAQNPFFDLSRTTGSASYRIANSGANLLFQRTADNYNTLSTYMMISNTGNVGIGTTTPGSLLSVGNTNGINFSTATSSFSATGGINLASGCFAVGGNCLSLSNGTIGGILPIANGGTNTGTQTTNGVNYYDGTKITSGSNLTYNGSTLSVTGSDTAGSTASLLLTTSATSTIFVSNSSAAAWTPLGQTGDTKIVFRGSSADAANTPGFVIGPWSASAKGIRIDSSGNVGIGTTTPSGKLDIYSASNNHLFMSTATQQWRQYVDSSTGTFYINDYTNSKFPFQIASGAPTYSFALNSSGYLGLGTTTPLSNLEVYAPSLGARQAAASIIGSAPTSEGPAVASGLYLNGGFTPQGGLYGINNQTAIKSATGYDFRGYYSKLLVPTGVAVSGSLYNMYLDSPTVSGTVSGSQYALYSADTNNSYFAGNVGIGTTTPNGPLSIQTSSLAANNGTVIAAQRSTNGDVFQGWHTTYTSGPAIGLQAYNNGLGKLYGGSDLQLQATNGSGGYIDLNSNGNVGIGTTTPGGTMGGYSGYTSLDVTSGSVQTWLRLSTAATGNDVTGVWFHPYDLTNAGWMTGTNNTGKFRIAYGTDTSEGAAVTAAKDGSTGITIDTSGNVGVGTASPRQQLSVGTYLDLYSGNSNSPTVPSIRANGSNLILNGNSTGSLYLNYDSGTGGIYLGNGAGGATGIIQSNGRVGIGTTTPAASLFVAGSNDGTPDGSGVSLGTSGSYASAELSGSAGGFIDFTTTGTDYNGRILYDNASNFMALYTNGAEKMRVDSSGNVGIGTTSPATTFSVGGSGYITGGLGIGTLETTAGRVHATNNITSDLRFYSGFGTAASPTYSFTSDSTTGLYRAGTYQLGIVTGGTERVRIDSSGNVGIGTTTPVSDYRTTIVPSGTAGYGALKLLSQNGSSGNQATAEFVGFRSDSNKSGTFSGTLALAHNRTDASISASDQVLGRVAFGGNADAANTYSSLPYTAAIEGITDGTVSASTSFPTALAFYTGSTGTLLAAANTHIGTERMRITSSGNVGIGTTTPLGKLETFNGEIIANSFGSGYGQLRMIQGNYGSFFRNDGTQTYLLLTNSGDQWGSYNSFRPFAVNNSTGAVSISTSGSGATTIGNASSALTVNSTSVTLSNITSGLVYANGSGVLSAVATSTWTFASSTLLSDSNTFSGANTFTQPLTLSGTSGTTTIASGQGFTIGSSQFVLQQGSGNVGIGTTNPTDTLTVKTNTTQYNGIKLLNSSSQSLAELIGGAGTSNDGGILSLWNGGVKQVYVASNGSSYLNGGNVGIGTTSPSGTLSTVGTIYGYKDGSTSIGAGGMTLYDAAGDRGLTLGATANSGSFYTFLQGGGGGTGQVIALNPAGGNVGIGTTTPTGLLTLAKTNSTQSGITNSALVLDNPTGSQSLINFSFGDVAKSQIRGDSSGNIVLDGSGSGAVILNYTSGVGGTGGTVFGNGAGSAVASVNSAGKGTFTNLNDSGLTASRLVATDGSKNLASTITTANLVSSVSDISGSTGTTNLVLSNSPTLVTPNLGTPSTLVLTNATGLPLTSGVTGILPIANGGTNASSQTTNGVNYFNGTSVTSGTGLTFTGTNLGIGTTSPVQKLDVNGSIALSSQSALTYYSTGNYMVLGTIGTNWNNTARVGDGVGFNIYTGGSSRVTIDPSGNFNISGLTASRLVATDGSKNLTNTITLANMVSSISDVTGSTGTGNLVLSASPTFTGTVNGPTYFETAAAAGNGYGFWNTVPSTYGMFMSNSATYQYGDVSDYYIANVMSSGTNRGFVWSYGTTPSMALNANSGNLAMKGTLTVNGTGNSTIAGNVGIGTTTPLGKLETNGDIVSTGLGLGGQLRMIYGNYGAMFRNDGTATYLLLTNSGDQWGSWNSFRPLTINNSTGATSINTSGSGATTIGNASSALTINSSSVNISGLTANRLVTTDGSKNLTNTITLANMVSSISDVTGSTGTGNLVLSASPTFTGTITGAAATLSGVLKQTFSGNAGGTSYWQQYQNDGTGNWNTYINSTGASSPTYVAAGAAYRQSTTLAASNNAYYYQYAAAGTAGAAQTWKQYMTVLPDSDVLNLQGSGGSVGIGTSSPATLFSVGGSGYLIGGLGVGVVNTTSGTLRTSGNALIGGSLGVGNASPQSILSVTGPSAGASASASGIGGIAQFTTGTGLNTDNKIMLGFDDSNNYGWIQSVDPGAAYRALALNPQGGNVGIGTTTPDSTLSVMTGNNATPGDGAISITTGGVGEFAFRMDGTSNLNIDKKYGGTWTSALTINRNNGYVGIGTTTPPKKLTIDGGQLLIDNNFARVELANGGTTYWTAGLQGATDYQILRNSGSGNVLIPTGNVGIGTTGPNYKLDVAGDINISSGSCYRVNGVCIGYVVKLAAIYATSTPGTNNKVVFTGAVDASPSFSSKTVTLQQNTSYIVAETWGGGGGGGSGGSGGAAGNNGSASSFGTGSATSTANGGTGGGGGAGSGTAVGGPGGTASGGDLNITGGDGNHGGYGAGGSGGSAPRGGTGGVGSAYVAGGTPDAGAAPGGGGGGGSANSLYPAGGGGAGGYSMKLYSAPVASTYYYNIGAGGAAGSGSYPGAAGGSGGVVITVYATSSPNSAGNDYAELFPVSNPLINAGDIVAVDAGTPVSMKLAAKGDQALAGIISTAPGQTLGDKNAQGMRPVALSGRVPTKVSLENGPIAIGDRIAVSSTPGVGMKAGPFDDSVGIALESYDGSSASSTIMVFVNIQRGLDINALGSALLGQEAAASSTASTSSPQATTSAPLDFVGGMINAIANRLTSSSSLDYVASTTVSTSSSVTVDVSPVGSFIHSLFARMTEWFASAQNGITDLFAAKVHTKELCITDDTGSSTCVTRAQLNALLTGKVATSTATGGDSSSGGVSSGAEPQLTVNGNNPATVQLGSAYNDLGATITGPQSALNLGITASVDGATSTPMSAVSIDTSVVGTHTIIYRVTDQSGLTGSATRTVNVVDSSTATSTTSSSTTSTVSTSTSTSTPSTDTATSTGSTTASGTSTSTSTSIPTTTSTATDSTTPTDTATSTATTTDTTSTTASSTSTATTTSSTSASTTVSAATTTAATSSTQ